VNIKLFKNSWTKFYKRAFITTFFITTFITLVDQGLSNPIFASKITSIKLLIDALLLIFYFSVGSGLLAIIALILLTIATKET
jgi:hypothetical protein|tara:strand:+ start:501 stop:749 length:249 start_codon:yes stop_codon:yes gene_type:complete